MIESLDSWGGLDVLFCNAGVAGAICVVDLLDSALSIDTLGKCQFAALRREPCGDRGNKD